MSDSKARMADSKAKLDSLSKYLEETVGFRKSEVRYVLTHSALALDWYLDEENVKSMFAFLLSERCEKNIMILMLCTIDSSSGED
jgi:hypothetical protein